MRRAVVSALISGLCLTLAACSHDQAAGPVDPPGNTTGSSLTTPTTTTPSDPAKDAPPVMPALAKQKSTAGAKAFTEYYIDVLNYSYLATSTKRLRAISSEDCAVCNYIAKAIDEMRRRGGQQKGAGWSVLNVASLPRSGPLQFNVVAHIKIAAGSMRRSRGAKIQDIRAERVYDDFYLVWRNDSWALRDFGPS